MRKFAAFLAVLLVASFNLTAVKSGEIAPEGRSDKSAKLSATYRPVSGSPTEILAGEVTRDKDFCLLAGMPVYSITGWFQGLEWYVNYQNPEEFGCVDVWPFQVTEVMFLLSTDTPVYFEVQGFVLEDAGTLECPFPGEALCQTPVYGIDIPGPGFWEITLPILEADLCCVNQPYFAAIFTLINVVPPAHPASDDLPDPCRSYIDRGTGWEDLVVDHGWPGQMMLYSAGFTNPQNPCDGGEGCCQLVDFDCIPADELECDELGGAWYPPPAECVDYPDGPACTYPYPVTVIVEPNDTSIWDKNYFSDTLSLQAIDFQPVSNVEYTVFEYFDGANWNHIGTDYDGTTYMRDPADTLQPGGDGWHASWHPGGLPEGYYMIRATMFAFDGMSSSDTVVQYWDPIPPEVGIIYPPVFNFPAEGPVDIQFYTPGDGIAEMYVIVYPIPDYPGRRRDGSDLERDDCIQGYNKGVPHLNQFDLYPTGAGGVNQGCVPTSITACLKYWAQNGHPCLDNNGTMSAQDMVNEIAGLLGTHPNTGTPLKKEKAAIDAYIKKHCGECVFQPTEHVQGKGVTQKRLIKELFEEDEDVITGDDKHVVVANSFCVHPRFYLDYMDPGTGTEVNQDAFNKGFDGDPLIDLIIVSPKEATQPVPTETVATTDEVEPVPEAPPGTYHYPWSPDPELFPVGSGYFVNVEITDGLGHKGWDLVKIELFIRGDATGDGIVDVGDIVYLVNYLYRNDIPPFPEDAGDATCDGVVDVGDVVYTVNYLFRGGDPPGCD